jgi:hypothetical protein
MPSTTSQVRLHAAAPDGSTANTHQARPDCQEEPIEIPTEMRLSHERAVRTGCADLRSGGLVGRSERRWEASRAPFLCSTGVWATRSSVALLSSVVAIPFLVGSVFASDAPEGEGGELLAFLLVGSLLPLGALAGVALADYLTRDRGQEGDVGELRPTQEDSPVG